MCAGLQRQDKGEMASMADRMDIWISIIAGIVGTLYGIGIIGTKAQDPRTAKFRQWAKWLGPLLVVIGLIRLFDVR